MEGLLAKVEAFVGDIPIAHAQASASTDIGEGKTVDKLAAQTDRPPMLAAEAASKLRGQAFLRPDRLHQVLSEAQKAMEYTLPELKRLMALHIDSSVARAILLRPVQQGLEQQKSKLLSVILSCVDAGQARRDIEQTVIVIHDHINAELTSN